LNLGKFSSKNSDDRFMGSTTVYLDKSIVMKFLKSDSRLSFFSQNSNDDSRKKLLISHTSPGFTDWKKIGASVRSSADSITQPDTIKIEELKEALGIIYLLRISEWNAHRK
jgi:hypothetical protein